MHVSRVHTLWGCGFGDTSLPLSFPVGGGSPSWNPLTFLSEADLVSPRLEGLVSFVTTSNPNSCIAVERATASPDAPSYSHEKVVRHQVIYLGNPICIYIKLLHTCKHTTIILKYTLSSMQFPLVQKHS